MVRFASGHFALHAHQVEAHRADDLVQCDQDAQLVARHHVIDHPPAMQSGCVSHANGWSARGMGRQVLLLGGVGLFRRGPEIAWCAPGMDACGARARPMSYPDF